MQQTLNYALNKPEQTDVVNVEDLNANFDTLDTELKKVSDKANLIQTAEGTGTAITLTGVSFVNGFTVTFVVASNNNGSATTINGKSLYKPGGTSAPTLTAGKAVTVWYNGTNFFIKASAEGDVDATNVLAGKVFSNDNDTGLTGTMPNNESIGTQTLSTEGAEYIIPVGYHNGLGKVKAVITGLIASAIKAGTTVGGILGTFTSDATATAAQMLSGVTAYVNGNKVTGNIASKGAATYNPSTSVQTIGAGQYISGTQTIAATTGTAAASDVLSGKTFNSANGIGLTGNIASKSAATYTPSTTSQVISAGQYLSGAQTIAGDANLVAGNILAGVSIFGRVGTAKRVASGTANSDNVSATLYSFDGYYSRTHQGFVTVSGLTFTPSRIIIRYDSTGNQTFETVYEYNEATGTYRCHVTSFMPAFQSPTAYNYGMQTPMYVKSTGFYLPVWAANVTGYKWIAIE